MLSGTTRNAGLKEQMIKFRERPINEQTNKPSCSLSTLFTKGGDAERRLSSSREVGAESKSPPCVQ